MSLDLLLFYLFSSFALISSIMVISLSNAVHSVLFLILVFCNVSGLLLLLGAEFLAFLLLIVYVGAIAVLFLFVIMMLNIKQNYTTKFISNLPLIILLCLLLIKIFWETVHSNFIFITTEDTYWISWIIENSSRQNIQVIGNVLYTNFSLLFLSCGLILLVAMIGAIVLTMNQRVNKKSQRIEIQLNRKPNKVIKFISLRN